MAVNFREALTVLSRALPLVLFRAGIFVAGGIMVIIIFAMLLVALRLAGGANLIMVIVVAVMVIVGEWLGFTAVFPLPLPGRHAAPFFRAFSPGSRGGCDHPRSRMLFPRSFPLDNSESRPASGLVRNLPGQRGVS
jgi:hypothetical protein